MLFRSERPLAFFLDQLPRVAALAVREDTERSDGDSHWASVVIDGAFEPRELTEAELERSNRVSDALATNRPEMDWIAATEIQRLAEEDPLAYPRGTAPAMAHLIERDRQRFGYGSKERS